MTRPWKTLDVVTTPDGELKLLQRGEQDFMITIAGRVLMVSQAHQSERALADLSLPSIVSRDRPNVLIGGLGMGYTLRAALDVLPEKATVVVAEINPEVVRWCEGLLTVLTGQALRDSRCRIEITDVAALIASAARDGRPFDAILLDLYEGPNEANRSENEAFYGEAAVAQTLRALTPGGVFAVWSEDPDRAFEKRLGKAGFSVERRRPDGGARRHAVYLAKRPAG